MFIIFEIYLIIAILAVLVFLYRAFLVRKTPMKGRNVVITGGSSGVGLAIAQECLDRGAKNIVLIARNKDGLENASKNILKKSNYQQILTFSADVSNWGSLKSVFDNIRETIKNIDYLFPNAGFAKPGLLQDTNSDDFQRQINVDFLGAAYATRLALPLMTENSHVTYSGSICSVFTFTGYSAYGSAKYALRALAETLRNELKSSKIHLHMGILSTVDTPGLVKENEVKPEVCAAIEGTANIFSPKEIAKKLIQGIDRGDYYITMEFLSWIMLEIGYGICPTNNIFMQLLFAPFIPIIRFGSLFYVDYLAKKPLPKPKTD